MMDFDTLINQDQDGDNFSSRSYIRPLKIKKITPREGFYFFYVGVDPKLKADYKPYELVKIVNIKHPENVCLGVLESAKDLRGVEVSEILAHNLKVNEGDEIFFESVQNVPGISQINVTKIDIEKPVLKEYNKDYYYEKDSSLDFEYPGYKKEEDSGGLLEYIKKTFSYSYLSDNHEFCYDGNWYKINVDETKKIKHFLILPNTKIKIHADKELLSAKSIIGLEEPYDAIKEAITWPKIHSSDYKALNITPSRGILLTGPPGCGKTHLVREISKSTDFYFIHIKGPEIISKYVGGSQKELRRIFEIAKKNQPSVIFFDEIDAIGSKRTNHSDNESRIVAQLLTLMDGLERRGQITVIAATNQPNLLDPSLRRPGRFDKEILVKPPSLEDRKKLFALFLGPLASSKKLDLDLLAEKTPGFVHADIIHLVNEAKINVIRRKQVKSKEEEKEQSFDLEMSDFEVSISKMDPSVLRQHYLLKDRKKTLDQIIGYEEVKEKIFDELGLPKRYPGIFKNTSLKKIKGILLQGPPGTGKTSLAKALASELNYNFISLAASDIISMYVGESEQKIREVFKNAAMSAPVILFFDEIDSIFGTSDKLKNLATHDVSKTGQLLTEIDGALSTEEDIVLIGTTNKAKYLDPALLRPGRFDLILTMDYPKIDELRQLYEYNFKNLTNIEDFSSVVTKSHALKLTGADIEAIKKKAVYKFLKTHDPKDLKNLEENIGKDNQYKINLTLQEINSAIDQFVKYRSMKPSSVDVSN